MNGAPIDQGVIVHDESFMDLSMELENVMDLAEAEPEMKVRCQEAEQTWENAEAFRTRTVMGQLESSMQASFHADVLRNREELSVAVAQLRSEAAAAAASASSQIAHESATFRTASRHEVELYSEVARKMCHDEEQQQFAIATQELHACYDRLFDERSEQVIAQSKFHIETARSEVEAVAQQYVHELESCWTSQRAILTSRLEACEVAEAMSSSASRAELIAGMQAASSSSHAVEVATQCRYRELQEHIAAAPQQRLKVSRGRR